MAKKMLLSMHLGLKPELIKIIFETERFPIWKSQLIILWRGGVDIIPYA